MKLESSGRNKEHQKCKHVGKKYIFLLISLKETDGFKVLTLHCGVYNTCKCNIYDNRQRKAIERNYTLLVGYILCEVIQY